MSVIDSDVDEILDEEVKDSDRKRLLQQILRWEEERVYDTIRTGKKDDLDEMITEHLKDQ
jgi:hypothetical protein